MKEKRDYKEYMKLWRAKNIEQRREYAREYARVRREESPKWKKVKSATGKTYYAPVYVKKKRKKKSVKKKYNELRGIALLKKYNLSKEEYNKLFYKQKGCCAICKKHQSEIKRKLAVDHCHETGRVRGLLCFTCNVGLGHFKDNENILQLAIAYLRK